ncbi:MAG: hypothetical protein RMI85_07055 [Candidatus Korarchaeum sp.]|nr:hypothetical protein [Candidatus Korarchaeum sp.]
MSTNAPIGIWQFREGVRKALRSELLKFPDLADAMRSLERSLGMNLNVLLRAMRAPKPLSWWVS